MADVKLDTTSRDVAVVDNAIVLTTPLEDEVLQTLIIRFRFFQGEFFMDLREGFPYYQEVFKKNIDLARIETAIRNTILTTPGVKNLTSLRVVFAQGERRLDVDFAARLEDGTEIVASQLGTPFIVEI